MELRVTLRNGESLLVTFGIPVGLLIFFSLVDVLPTDAERPVDFLLPGVLALSVMSASMVALAIATGFERYWLVLKRLGATPLRRAELIGAKILAISLVQGLQIAVVLVVGVGLLGYRAEGGGRAPLWLAPVAIVLGTSAFAGLGLAMAGRLRAVATLALANAAYLMLLLISGIAFPLDRLPDWLAMLARALPAAPLAELLRAALGAPATPVPVNLLILLAWAVGAPALASSLFRWE
ncbi:MAG: ABC transporter permease [Nitriliruptorales bacterium]|nr:ABC transporter permease [Nitriliruptorales bacterium]